MNMYIMTIMDDDIYEPTRSGARPPLCNILCTFSMVRVTLRHVLFLIIIGGP